MVACTTTAMQSWGGVVLSMHCVPSQSNLASIFFGAVRLTHGYQMERRHTYTRIESQDSTVNQLQWFGGCWLQAAQSNGLHTHIRSSACGPPNFSLSQKLQVVCSNSNVHVGLCAHISVLGLYKVEQYIGGLQCLHHCWRADIQRPCS